MTKLELLSPAGDMEKLKTAIYFGADAVYVAGKNFGLRAFAGILISPNSRSTIRNSRRRQRDIHSQLKRPLHDKSHSRTY